MYKVEVLSMNRFNSICRTCLATGDLQLICANEVLLSKYKYCTKLQIEPDDQLPKKICAKCVKEINQTFSFLTKCKTVDDALRKCVVSSSQNIVNIRTNPQIYTPTVEKKIGVEINQLVPLKNSPQTVTNEHEFASVFLKTEVLSDYENEDIDEEILGVNNDVLTDESQNSNQPSSILKQVLLEPKDPIKIELQSVALTKSGAIPPHEINKEVFKMRKTNAEKCKDYYYRRKAAKAAQNPQGLRAKKNRSGTCPGL